LKRTSPQQELQYFLRQAAAARALAAAAETTRQRESFLKIAQFWTDLARESAEARSDPARAHAVTHSRPTASAGA